MNLSFCAVVTGFSMDLLLGDPHGFPHPVIFMGRLISRLEGILRRIFPKTARGERFAGGVLWLLVTAVSFGIPAWLLWLCNGIHPFFRLAAESVMCWQILAVKSLKDEAMKVYEALADGDHSRARAAVSMIVGRDTERLDEAGIARAAVETVAENTCDGVVAPLFFLFLGGAPLGFLYKAVNTMDSMVGYVDPPYKDFGFFPARADDLFNFFPARLSALFMLAAGGLLGFDARNGLKIFRRDRFRHASPNSAQTEAACAGLLGLRLAGDAWYHGVLHKKEYIGDGLRKIASDDIQKACRLLYGTSFLALAVFGAGKYFIL